MHQCLEEITIGSLQLGNHLPFVLFAGLNVLEAEKTNDTLWQVCDVLKEQSEALKIPWVFKASFDKANRTAIDSWRGPGLESGLKQLLEVKQRYQVAVMTDIHEPSQAAMVAEVADFLQIPAFLCRQTDLILAAAATSAVINIKKAQFLAAADMGHILDKALAGGNQRLMLCERGSAFGYHNLVVDMLALDLMKEYKVPILFDATHSLQMPGANAGGKSAGGRAQQLLPLARSAMIQGLAGLFLEVHPNPEKARCDGPSALVLDKIPAFLQQIKAIDTFAKTLPSI